MATTTLRTQCHCKKASFTFAVPSTSLPLSSAFCSCSSCRYSSGQLVASFATIPRDPKELNIDVSQLSAYASSDHRTRYFCPTCGANVFDFARSDGMWRACTGTLDRTGGLIERNQIFIGDTHDGGLSMWLKGVGTMFDGSPVDEPKGIQSAGLQQRDPSDRPATTRLHGSCHCNGIQFDILPPSNGGRYEAGLCTCTSCRTTTGFEITAWVSVPLSRVRMPGSQPLDLSAGTLEQYLSSPGVARHFCRRCGAIVFCSKAKQSWIDIGAGLLRANEGARVERWLHWRADVDFWVEATDQELIARLRDGLKLWASGCSST